MRWIDRLGTAQRVVVVIALGLALGILASYLTSPGTRTGWCAYAPLSAQVFQPLGVAEPGWLRVIIWLAAISLWTLTSLRVLRQSLAGTIRNDRVRQPLGRRQKRAFL
jgi:heme/copper-type cytochrome/quinol oxidase subunit 1